MKSDGRTRGCLTEMMPMKPGMWSIRRNINPYGSLVVYEIPISISISLRWQIWTLASEHKHTLKFSEFACWFTDDQSGSMGVFMIFRQFLGLSLIDLFISFCRAGKWLRGTEVFLLRLSSDFPDSRWPKFHRFMSNIPQNMMTWGGVRSEAKTKFKSHTWIHVCARAPASEHHAMLSHWTWRSILKLEVACHGRISNPCSQKDQMPWEEF
jgi:hypothetical protein